jgi:hypothetical protein
VTLGPPDDPGRDQGRIDFLRGTELRAVVGGAGRAIRLRLSLSLGEQTVTGTLDATPIARDAR